MLALSASLNYHRRFSLNHRLLWFKTKYSTKDTVWSANTCTLTMNVRSNVDSAICLEISELQTESSPSILDVKLLARNNQVRKAIFFV